MLLSRYFQKLRDDIRKREEEMRASQNFAIQNTNQSSINGDNTLQGDRQNGFLGTALSNVLVIVGLAMFAYTVKYVLRTVVEWWQYLHRWNGQKCEILLLFEHSPHKNLGLLFFPSCFSKWRNLWGCYRCYRQWDDWELTLIVWILHSKWDKTNHVL